MTRLQLFRMLRQNVKLSEKRHPALEQSKVAKVMMYIGGAFMAVYMIVFGSFFGRLAAEDDEPAVLFLILPLFLLLDFLGRFMVQQTPLVFFKPYLLMPLPAKSVVESYLVTMVLSSYNFLWLALLLPYAYVCIVAGLNVWAVLAVVCGGMLMVMINSQWYLLVRTLIVRSLLWWLLPIAVYGLMVLPVILEADDFFDSIERVVEMLYSAPVLWLLVVVLLAVLLGLMLLNRNMQYAFIYSEITREQKRPAAIKHVSEFSFLERFGQNGEYLKLELKSIFRNKTVRSRVLMSLGLIVMLSALISYTDVYDGPLILNFWCYYCFSIYGMTALVKVMEPEGNYIDLLMTQRENILSLLKAKYYFHVAILVVPLLIMMPAVFAGKFTWLMMLAYLLLTSGPTYFILFQLAVYNKQTLPLDDKLTGKNGVESGFQLLIELLAMLGPLVIVAVLLFATDETTAYALMAVLGLLFTIAHPLWLRNIYSRMMLRKYENMEGFHATRS